MDVESIKAHVLALPELAAWPEIAALAESAGNKPRPDWELPLLACQAVGGDASVAIPGAAAIACMQISIILVDDMLDEDPRGVHLRHGAGPTANMALAFQAAAFRVIEQSAVSESRRAAITASLAWMALTTALGQHQDVQNPSVEDEYWKMVRTKSTPFYRAALHVGALLGNASDEVAEGLRTLGVPIGEIIQIRDDLFDAFQSPANPDWTRGRANLPILYARIADHPDRARFVGLLPQCGDPQALREAQQILIRCGAVSYCAYHLTKRRQQAEQLQKAIPLADPAPIADLITRQMQPLEKLLRAGGVENPEELMDLSL